MLHPESDGWEKRIKVRQVDEFQKAMRWFVLVGFPLNWYVWFLLIYRHWEQMGRNGSAIGGVFLLVFYPMPGVFMFYKRETYPPVAAMFTYILLAIASEVAFAK